MRSLSSVPVSQVAAMTLQDGDRSGRPGPLPHEPKENKVRCKPSPNVQETAASRRGTLSPRQKQDCLFAAKVAKTTGIRTVMHGMVCEPPSALEPKARESKSTAKQDGGKDRVDPTPPSKQPSRGDIRLRKFQEKIIAARWLRVVQRLAKRAAHSLRWKVTGPYLEQSLAMRGRWTDFMSRFIASPFVIAMSRKRPAPATPQPPPPAPTSGHNSTAAAIVSAMRAGTLLSPTAAPFTLSRLPMTPDESEPSAISNDVEMDFDQGQGAMVERGQLPDSGESSARPTSARAARRAARRQDPHTPGAQPSTDARAARANSCGKQRKKKPRSNQPKR